VTATLDALVVDAADPDAVMRFWHAALGESAQQRYLRFRLEQRPKVVKNRVHLDVYVRDIAALLDLGARVLAEYPPTRATLADVEGNEFCAFLDPELSADAPARVFAVCTDSDRPAELAAWWANVVGANIGDGPDGTPRYLYAPVGWEHLIWKFVPVDDERVVPNRWQWTLRANPAELVGVNSSSDVLVDPQGNEFTVTPRRRPAG
jgi:hypothetical protein